MFRRDGTKITPGSKLRFWTEPDQLNMLAEIKFLKKEEKLDMEPLRMPAGKIWVSIEESIDRDILQDDEIVHSP